MVAVVAEVLVVAVVVIVVVDVAIVIVTVVAKIPSTRPNPDSFTLHWSRSSSTYCHSKPYSSLGDNTRE